MISEFVSLLVQNAAQLLGELTTVFNGVFELIYDASSEITVLGQVLVATAGFALAWSGIRFVFGLITRLLNKTRAGR